MGNKVQEITITPTQGVNGIQWAMSYEGKGFAPGDYPKISLPHDSGKHDFHFTIAPNQWNITFKSGDGMDSPIWIQEIQGTPPNTKPTPGVVHKQQITDISVVNNGTELRFTDKNHGAKKDLTYQLNFNDNVAPLDPIIQNGGGGGPGQGYFEFILDHPIETAAAILLLLASLWALMRRRAARPEVNTGNTGGTGPV